MDFDKINQFNQAQQEAQDKQVLLNTITSAGDKVAEAVNKSDNKTVTVTNDLAKPSDIEKVVEAVKAIDLKPQDLQPIADALDQVSQAIAKLPTEYPEFPELPEAPEQREDVKVTNLAELKEYFQDVVTAVGKLQTSIKFDPKIEVKPADVKVTEQKIDLTPVTKGLANLEKAFKNIKTPNFDTTDILGGLESVYNSINNLSFPVPNYVLPFKGTDGEATQVQLVNGALPITGTITASSDGAIVDGVSSSIKATVKDLTNSNPLATQIMDANGDAITSFGGGTQYSDGDVNADPTGTVAMGTDGSNVFALHTDTAGDLQVDVLSMPTTAVTGTFWQATQPVSAASLPLPSGAATAANQQTDALTDAELRATPVVVDLGANNDVTVTSGAITETNSAAIKTAVEILDNAISGSEMQVDVVAALPAGTNAIGKLAANSGVDIGDVDVTSMVSATLDHGSNRDIDTAAEQITSTSFACKFGVTLKADATNTGIIYVGNSDVTAGTTAATDGFPLAAGDTLTLEVTNSNIPYAIASANNQIIYWVAV